MNREKMNSEIVSILRNLAFFLELSGANPFKTKAIVNGAQIVRGFDIDVKELLDSGELQKTKGIGKGILAIIEEYLVEGKSSELEALAAAFPENLLELRDIPGLGPKKIKALYKDLEIASLAELEYACNENRLLDLKGFGKKSQDKIVAAIDELKLNRGKVLLPIAEHVGNSLTKKLIKLKGVKDVTVVGELRRLAEVISSLDLLIELDLLTEREALTDKSDKSLVKFFEKNEVKELATELETEKETEKGKWTFIGEHEEGFKVRAYVMGKNSKASFSALLAELTGPDTIAKKIQSSEAAGKAKTEEAVFKSIKLPWIPPELRDSRVDSWSESGGKGKLALKLVEPEDIRGVFHLHTTASDGANSLKEMADKCQELGFSYMGVSDHSQTAFYASGLKADAVKKQREEIDKLNVYYEEFCKGSSKNFKIFHGIESDILPDGKLDYPDKVLKEFDFVIASIHSQFRMSSSDMTERICAALKNPYTTWLGHPTGRLLLGRKGYEFDFEAVFATASDYGKGIELNSNPYRLDLDWRLLQTAVRKKIPIGIFPDAHSVRGLEDYRYGVMMARKGGLAAKHVSNTRTLPEMEKWLKRK